MFEHVFDPLASAREVRRVLKDGGRFYIDTAFMQLYHGFPSHYLMASSFVVVGRKPHAYNSRRKDDAHSISARRGYYAARLEVMMHHSHAIFYANRTDKDSADIPNIKTVLSIVRVEDPTDTRSFEEATDRLRNASQEMQGLASLWMRRATGSV